jgi:hypothetical protein
MVTVATFSAVGRRSVHVKQRTHVATALGLYEVRLGLRIEKGWNSLMRLPLIAIIDVGFATRCVRDH